MNRIYVYIGSIFSLIAVFTLIYYFSYQSAYKKLEQEQLAALEQTEENVQQNQETAGDSDNNGDTQAAGKSAVSVDTVKEQVVTGKTKCIMERYNDKGSLIETQTIAVPSELIGCTREEVVEYVTEYMQDLPLEEYLDGLVSYEVVSFSKDRICLRKTYDDDAVEFRYYIVAKNDEVVVYYSDKKTVYEYTGIPVSNLTSEDQTELSYGILVTDDEELYGILENYSS